MKKLITIVSALAICALASAFTTTTPKGVKYVYTEATDLTLIGKLCDTPNPYHRVDTVKYKGFTAGEKNQMISSAGLIVAFKTNSTSIYVKPEYGFCYRPLNGTDIAYAGFDLYIKKDGQWLWAGYGVNKTEKQNEPVKIISNMDGSEHECLLYLPMYSELYSVKIGIEEGKTIKPLENPFHNRIGIFGSSYTQGVSCSRSGMTYPKQLERMTGYNFLSIAASGNCKMQPYFADVICDAKFDAFVFDSFSNPDDKMIKERLEPFIQKIRAAHPTEPLIFQQTIRREHRNFDVFNEDKESKKQAMADSLMKIMCKKYPNVYFIQTNATHPTHDFFVDGTHPDDYGYYLWACSVKKQIVSILKKNGIK